MNQTTQIEQLARYFSGEASATEREQVEAWRAESTENQQMFDSHFLAWQLTKRAGAKNIASPSSFNTEKAWSNMEKRLGFEPETSESIDEKKTKVREIGGAWRALRMLPYVAILVVGMGGGFWLIKTINSKIGEFDKPDIVENKQPETAPVFSTMKMGEDVGELHLADNSVVSLRQGGELRFPQSFDGEIRKVYLTGSAFFEVERDTNHPFVVETPRGMVQVLGTSFYVNAESSEQLEVTVKSGKVAVYANKAHLGQLKSAIPIEAGQRVVVNKEGVKLETNNDPNMLAWKSKVLRFRNTPLPEVIGTLSDYYQRPIVLSKKSGLQACKFTGKYRDKPLHVVLESLETIYGAKIKEEKGVVYVEEGRCP